MFKHPYFRLFLHDDEELATILGASITERTTVHEWPLSCVQRLRLSDGTIVIYKVQADFSVEPQFYMNARSPLLVQTKVIGEQSDVPPALLLEYVDAPRLADLTLERDEALRLTEEVIAQIAQVEGELPYLHRIGSLAEWKLFTRELISDLETLVRSRTFQKLDQAAINHIASFCADRSVIAAIESPSGLVHGDLNGGNLILHPQGMKLIDWQRAIYGPVELNRANMLEQLGINAKLYVSTGIMNVLTLLKISWFTACALHWFPEGAEGYDEGIVEFAAQLYDIDGTNGF